MVIVKRSFRGFKEEASKYRFTVGKDVVEEFIREEVVG